MFYKVISHCLICAEHLPSSAHEDYYSDNDTLDPQLFSTEKEALACAQALAFKTPDYKFTVAKLDNNLSRIDGVKDNNIGYCDFTKKYDFIRENIKEFTAEINRHLCDDNPFKLDFITPLFVDKIVEGMIAKKAMNA
jgi:hypothetical protein